MPYLKLFFLLHSGCWLSANKNTLFLFASMNNDSVEVVFVLAEFNIFPDAFVNIVCNIS